jgi:hypothetical protein
MTTTHIFIQKDNYFNTYITKGSQLQDVVEIQVGIAGNWANIVVG